MKEKFEPKIDPVNSPSLKNWGDPPESEDLRISEKDVYVECGWGRLIFSHTFDEHEKIAALIRGEVAGKRDIAFYIRDPHVIISLSPQEFFLDPSYTYRFWLENYEPEKQCLEKRGIVIRKCNPETDLPDMNRIYRTHGMVPIDTNFLKNNEDQEIIIYLVAVEEESGKVLGSVMGVDHVLSFDDPENGSSLWALAVDPQANVPGLGKALVQELIELYRKRGRTFMDLSVLHTNKEAITLYENMGFERVPVFCLKRKNAINEKLYIGPEPEGSLNPYSKIIIKEARLRGIGVKVIDAENNYFELSHGGRAIVCRESLSELTTALAMSRCADKSVTHRLVDSAGIHVPAQRIATHTDDDFAFLRTHNYLAVKPADSEQGKGISLMVSSPDELELAIKRAETYCSKVVLEQFVTGQDLRIVVIDFKVVAAAIRKPAEVTGSGEHTILELIKKQSRRREAATQGESRIPIDRETEKCVNAAGYRMDDILPPKKKLTVRRTANLHTGGTIHDVTGQLHPELAKAAILCAQTINIPVVGIDFMVKNPEEEEYFFIEANERPGLANHEPQPTAERFVDLLFPATVPVEVLTGET